MNVRGYSKTLVNCCGVYEIGDFHVADGDYEPPYMWSGLASSGTGLSVSTFIDEPEQREAYEQLKKVARIRYQSPVKYNKNSGNRLFLVVWEKKN